MQIGRQLKQTSHAIGALLLKASIRRQKRQRDRHSVNQHQLSLNGRNYSLLFVMLRSQSNDWSLPQIFFPSLFSFPSFCVYVWNPYNSFPTHLRAPLSPYLASPTPCICSAQTAPTTCPPSYRETVA